MTKTMHSAVTLDYLEARTHERLAKAIDDHDTQERAIRGLALKDISDLRSKGYTYWPGCDNVDARGHCAGHEKEE